MYLEVANAELADLVRELNGEETPRARALALSVRVAQIGGFRVSAACLVDRAPGLVGTEFEIETPYGIAYVAGGPGEILAAAATLGVPLLADRSLLENPPTEPPELSDPVRTFLKSLGLDREVDSN